MTQKKGKISKSGNRFHGWPSLFHRFGFVHFFHMLPVFNGGAVTGGETAVIGRLHSRLLPHNPFQG